MRTKCADTSCVNLRVVGVMLSCFLAGGVAGVEAKAPGSSPDVAQLEFRVCVVDEAPANDSTAERAALRARIVKCFQQTLGEGWRELHDEQVSTKIAAKRMKARDCEAVIFFGARRPRKLRRLDVVTFAVDLGRERNYEPVYLIVPARERHLHKKILADFPKALAPLHPPDVMLAAR